MPFDGFNPSAPRGEPASSAIFAGGSGSTTPTIIDFGPGDAICAGLQMGVGDALNVNMGVGDAVCAGIPIDVLIPTVVDYGPGDARCDGIPITVAGRLILKITISYFGRTETIPIYDKGDIARISATFTNEASGLEVNPGTVTFRVRKPGGTIVTDTEVTAETSGAYYVDLQLDTEGTWRFRWETNAGREEGEFIVQATAMD